MRTITLMQGSVGARDAQLATGGDDRDLAVVATGTTTADAYILRASITQFGTVAAGTGARIPTVDLVPGDEFHVLNNGANALLVYPPSGGTINSAGVDVGNSLAAGAGAVYKMWSSLGAMRLA